MKGLEWVIIVVLMAIFGLLGQWLENASKGRQRRAEPRRQPKRPQPADLDEYLREILRGGPAQEARRPTERAEPAVPGRPVTPPRPPTDRVDRPRRPERAPQRPGRPARSADRPPTRRPQPTVPPREGRLAAPPERLPVSVREPLVAPEDRELIQTEAVMAAPYAQALEQSALASDVIELLVGAQRSKLLAAVVIADLLRAPVTQRQHLLPALRPLPTPLLPPPAVESWI